MRIRILPEAEHDLEIGADFYESQGQDLGRYFSDCLMADIESLRVHAGVHERQSSLHRCMSKRSPFAIFYDVTNEIIVPLDGLRQPGQLLDELAGRGHETPQPDKCPHDLEVGSGGHRRAQDA